MHNKNDKQAKGPATDHPIVDEILELLNDYFSWLTAHEYREEMWQYFMVMLASAEIDDWSGEDRSNMAFFMRRTADLYDYLEFIHLQIKDSRDLSGKN